MAQPTSSSSYSRASIDPDRIRLYAETCGTSNVTSDAYTVMAEELTNILRKIVSSARNYAVHGRRTRLDVEDVRRACEDMRIQPPLGYVAPCVATMRHIPNNAGEDFFVREYPEYDIQSLLASPPRPLPLKMHLRMHWLAFEGVVQAVPENIIPIKEEVEDEQEDLLSGRPSRIQVRRDTAAQPLQGNASTSYRVAARSVVQQEHVTVKPIHPATLSMERQAYVKNVIEACVGPADQSRIYALQSLEMDTGLQEALPTLALIIKNGVRANVIHKCLSMLIYLVRIVRSMALNKSVNMEPVLHLILPSLLSCVVGKSLCLRPESDNHWALRDFASKTLVLIIRCVREYSRTFDSFQQRIVRFLKRIVEDPESSYAQVYGAVATLHELVNEKERVELCSRYYELVDGCSPSSAANYHTEVMRVEANKLYVLLMRIEPQMRRCTTVHQQRRRLGMPGPGMGQPGARGERVYGMERLGQSGPMHMQPGHRIRMMDHFAQVPREASIDDVSRPSCSSSSVSREWITSLLPTVPSNQSTLEFTQTALADIAHVTAMRVRMLMSMAKRNAIHCRRSVVEPSDVQLALNSLCAHTPFGARQQWTAPSSTGCTFGGYESPPGETVEAFSIASMPSIKVPPSTSLNKHWLVIEGVQPLIPENPPPEEAPSRRKEGVDELGFVSCPKGGSTLWSTASYSYLPTSSPQLGEIGLPEGALTWCGRLPWLPALTEGGELKEQSEKDKDRDRNKETQKDAKTLHISHTPLNQKVFFDLVIANVMGNDEEKRTETLHILVSNSGHQTLVPRLIIYVVEGIRFNVGMCNLRALCKLIRLAHAIVLNRTHDVSKLLPELLPAIVSCAVSARLSSNPMNEDHWALRRLSAHILSFLCRQYDHVEVRARVTRVLSELWLGGSDLSFATLYGALYSLSQMGAQTVAGVCFPRLPVIYNRVESALLLSPGSPVRYEAEKLAKLIVRLCAEYVIECNPVDVVRDEDYTAVFGGFGERVCQLVKEGNVRLRFRSGKSVIGFGGTRSQVTNQRLSRGTPSPAPSGPPSGRQSRSGVTTSNLLHHTSRMFPGSESSRRD